MQGVQALEYTVLAALLVTEQETKGVRYSGVQIL